MICIESQKKELSMKNHTVSAKISLAVCIFFAVVLAAAVFSFQPFIQWFYVGYHHLNPDSDIVQKNLTTVISAFYACVPFAAAALYMLIRLLLNILKDRVFIAANVTYVRLVSLFCYAVAAITLVTGVGYFPLLIICFATGTVGTLLLVMKNLLRGAVELREENELTI